eukprot:4171334-Pyramimonas_sp.AAC.1
MRERDSWVKFEDVPRESANLKKGCEEVSGGSRCCCKSGSGAQLGDHIISLIKQPGASPGRSTSIEQFNGHWGDQQ